MEYTSGAPYQDSSTNFIYQLLFCDDISLYKDKTKLSYRYPFSILFEEKSNLDDLQGIIDDENTEPRIKVLERFSRQPNQINRHLPAQYHNTQLAHLYL